MVSKLVAFERRWLRSVGLNDSASPGLRGTGSFDWTVEDVFLPEEIAQYLAAVYGWGPASVLKHTDVVNTRRQGGSKTKHLGLEMSATITPHPVTHLMP